MYCVRNVTSDLYWVGANDHRLALFENCFPIPRGVSYNAYCLLDEKTVLFDTVDWSACRQLLENLNHVLAGRELDYLLINHLEPDHAACIEEILLRHPKVKVISNEKAFMLMRQFGFHVDDHECIEVKEGDTFSFGRHTVTFVGAPPVKRVTVSPPAAWWSTWKRQSRSSWPVRSAIKSVLCYKSMRRLVKCWKRWLTSVTRCMKRSPM